MLEAIQQYDLSNEFSQTFGTVKMTSQLDFFLFDRSKKNNGQTRTQSSNPQFPVTSNGCQTLYVMKHSPTSFHLAFCNGSDRVTFFQFPHNSQLSGNALGGWFCQTDANTPHGVKVHRAFDGQTEKTPNPTNLDPLESETIARL